MIGAAVIKVTAAGSGIPFFIRLRKTGTEAQSQTGRKKPPTTPNSNPGKRRCGKILCKNPSGTKTVITVEINTPRTRNGTASSQVPEKMVNAFKIIFVLLFYTNSIPEIVLLSIPDEMRAPWMLYPFLRYAFPQEIK
jgi:hypothetical protein